MIFVSNRFRFLISYYTIPRASAVINKPQVIEEDVDFCLTDLEKTGLALSLSPGGPLTGGLSLSLRSKDCRETPGPQPVGPAATVMAGLGPDVLLCLPGGATLFSTCMYVCMYI